MKRNNLRKIFSTGLLALVAVMLSCNDEERFTSQDTSDITEEAITDTYFQDIDDLTAVAIGAPNDNEYSGGRVFNTIVIDDNRFKCNGVVVTVTPADNSTPEVPKGVMVVDFGAGCTDARGNERTGKLIFTYNGRRFMAGSTVVTTTENYTINGVKLEGVRTLTNVQASSTSAPRFNVVLQNGKAIFPNGQVAERTSNITWGWVRAANPADDRLVIDQSSTASGITRGGREYVVSLLEDLVYKRFCGMAVEGIKKYTINGVKEITIDYGDGTCDRIITVTVNDVTRNISVNG